MAYSIQEKMNILATGDPAHVARNDSFAYNLNTIPLDPICVRFFLKTQHEKSRCGIFKLYKLISEYMYTVRVKSWNEIRNS